MEFVYIEAKTFMEMNEALEAIARRVHETCGGSRSEEHTSELQSP